MNCPKGFARKFKTFLHKINFYHLWDDSKNQPNGNKLRTYRIFKKCYERETYLFVNELSKSEISTFAKLNTHINFHIFHIS